MITIKIPALQENLGISIDVDKPKISTKEIPKEEKKSKKDPIDEKLAGYGLQLMSRDELSTEHVMDLSYKITLCIRKLMKEGEKQKVRDFLVTHKHHLPSELKDLLSMELKHESL